MGRNSNIIGSGFLSTLESLWPLIETELMDEFVKNNYRFLLSRRLEGLTLSDFESGLLKNVLY
jgi:hypothetical protein